VLSDPDLSFVFLGHNNWYFIPTRTSADADKRALRV